jgi:hypothetical protein
MSHVFACRKRSAFVLSLALFVTTHINLFGQDVTAAAPNDHAREAKRSFLLLNSPSTMSEGPDSLLSLDARGNSSVFYGKKHGMEGADDIACRSVGRPQIVAAIDDYNISLAELLFFDQSGKLERRFSLGPPYGGGLALGFDPAGNLYAATPASLWKNGKVIATNISPNSEIGKLVADDLGNVYITLPVTSQLIRVNQAGDVFLLAGTSVGLNGPYGIALGANHELYVANNPPSAPAYIIQFAEEGTPSIFAANISLQPDIRGLAYVPGHDGNGAKLYATLAADNSVLEFDESGNSTVFADSSDRLDFPFSITPCPSRW